MGTRAIVAFKDETGEYPVFKHWDGRPDVILPMIEDAKGLAWDLPRWEASDYAAAFVATHKRGGGDIRLEPCVANWREHADFSYLYEVTFVNEKMRVRIFTGSEVL